jgi:hypothetical protein
VDDWDAWDTDDYWEFIDLDGQPGTSDNLVSAIRIDDAGKVILGTRDHKHGDGDGVRLYDPTAGTWQALRTADDGLPSNHVTDIKRDPASGDLWVATENRGVARFDGQHWRSWGMFAVGDRVGYTTVDARVGNANIATDIADRATYDRLFPGESSYVRIGDDKTLYRLLGYTVASKAIRITPGLTRAAPAGTGVYTVDRGPASDSSTQIAIDANGTVWVGGRETIWLGSCGTWPYCWLDGGLAKWDGTRWTVYDFDTAVTHLTDRDNEVQAVEVDTGGRVWAGTGNAFQGQDGRGIFVYDPAAKIWSVYNTEGVKARYFGGDGVADLDRDPTNGDMWVVHHSTEVCSNNSPFGDGCSPTFTGGGVSRFDGTTWRKWTKQAGAYLKAAGTDGDLATVKVDRTNDRIWAGGYDTGASFHWLQGIDIDAVINWCPLTNCTNEAWKNQTWPDEGEVTAIEVDDLGKVWVGVHRYGTGITPPAAGVKLFDGTTWQVYTPDNSGLPSNEITVLQRDGTSMWVGTRRDGLGIYMREAAPTPTPVVTNTPRATLTPTRPPTDEPTPTVVGPGTTAPTASATRVPSPTPGGPTLTPSPGCGPADPCPLSLPFVLQRRTCTTNCINPVQRTATRPPASATPSRTVPPLVPTDTATVPATAAATEVPSDTPTATPTVGPSPTGQPSRTPTRTSSPPPTATPTSTATLAAVKAWAAYAGNMPRVAYYSVSGLDASHVWVAGDKSTVYYWDGATMTRQKDNIPDDLTLRRVFMFSTSRGFLVGDTPTTGGSAFYETRNGGELWRKSGSDTYVDNWHAVAVARKTAGGYLGWALGNLNGNRLLWDGTADWSPQSPGDRNNRTHAYSDVAVLDDTHAYAVSDAATGARIYSWDGTTWSPGPSTTALYDLHVLSPTQGVAVGRGGAVWRLTADGWARMDTSPRTGGQDLYTVHMLADDRIWAAGARGKMYLWDGIGWNDLSIGGQVKAIRNLWMTAAGDDGWAVGDDGLVLRYR